MNRNDFPILKKVTYLDSAAAILKPNCVIDAISNFYRFSPINIHSAQSHLGVMLTKKINETRTLVANMVDAKEEEVIFTSGATDGLNKFALMIKEKIKKDDEILVSYYNHSSNIVPWIEIAKSKKAKIIYTKSFVNKINKKTKIIALASQNNTINVDLKEKQIYKLAKKFDAIVVNDAAQSIAHKNVSLQDSDVIVFSANKLYGPTGMGSLIVKSDLLKKINPQYFGGGATSKIEYSEWISKKSIKRFEPGTPNLAGIIGLGQAIKYFNENKNFKYEKELAVYAHQKINTIEGVNIYSEKGDTNIIFNIGKYSAQDIVSYLGHKNIIVRSGSHCAKMLYKVIEPNSTIRVSIASYNNQEDINLLVKTLKEGGDFIEFI